MSALRWVVAFVLYAVSLPVLLVFGALHCLANRIAPREELR